MAFYKKFLPTDYVENIYKINYDFLKKQGVKSLFFDLDNTLIAYDEDVILGESLSLLESLSKDFNIVVVSNSPKKRVMKAVSHFDYIHFARKPLKVGLKKAINIVKNQKHEVCLIGDQVLTDVFGANRLGIDVILVKPLKKSSDKWITSFNRKIAQKILKGVKKRYPKRYSETIELYEK